MISRIKAPHQEPGTSTTPISSNQLRPMTPRWIAVQLLDSCSSAVEQLKQTARPRRYSVAGETCALHRYWRPFCISNPQPKAHRSATTVLSSVHQSGSFGSRRPVNCTRSQGPRADHFAGRRGGCVPTHRPRISRSVHRPTPPKEAKVNTSGETPHPSRPCPPPTSRNVDASNRITKKNPSPTQTSSTHPPSTVPNAPDQPEPKPQNAFRTRPPTLPPRPRVHPTQLKGPPPTPFPPPLHPKANPPSPPTTRPSTISNPSPPPSLASPPASSASSPTAASSSTWPSRC